MKHSLICLLLFFVAFGFLTPQLLAIGPAELAGETLTEEREESVKEPAARLVCVGKKAITQPFLNISDVLRSCLTAYRGNIHLLQVFLV